MTTTTTTTAPHTSLPIPDDLRLPPTNIDLNPNNPRRFTHNPAFDDLIANIATHGILQPLIIEATHGTDRYTLLAGERRLRAALHLNLPTIPTRAYTNLTPQQRQDITILENLQRENLTPLEEAAGIAALLPNATPAEIAARLGKPLPWITRRIRLTTLHPHLLTHINDPSDPLHRLPILTLEHIAAHPQTIQAQLLQDLLADPTIIIDTQTITNLLQRYQHTLSQAPFDPRETIPSRAFAEGRLAPCIHCPDRTSHTPDLFNLETRNSKLETAVRGVSPDDRCLNPTCYTAKIHAHIIARHQALTAQGRAPILHATGPVAHLPPEIAQHSKPLDLTHHLVTGPDDPAAIPVITILGPHAGRLDWYKKPTKPTTTTTPDKSDPSETSDQSDPKPPTIADRQLAVHRRRWIHTARALTQILRETRPTILPNDAISIQPGSTPAVTFNQSCAIVRIVGRQPYPEDPGSLVRESMAPASPWVDLYTAITNDLADPIESAIIGLEHSLQVLANRLNATIQTPDALPHEINQIARILNLDTEPLETNAIAAHPYPARLQRDLDAANQPPPADPDDENPPGEAPTQLKGLARAFFQGQQARLAGRAITTNPYIKASYKMQWTIGFNSDQKP